jgi:hypothetical protein
MRFRIIALVAVVVALAGCDVAPSVREPSPVDWYTVNAQPYSYGDLGPVEVAYRTVARHRGWSEATIEAWLPFIVHDVVKGESGGCYNVRRGVRLANGGQGCAIARQGRGSDSGFGQLISLHYRSPSGALCRDEELCSADAITATAWDSMTALLWLVERSGRHGWCYNARARSYHPGCSTAPTTFTF